MQSHILKYCSCRGADLEITLLESSGVSSENYFDLFHPASLDVKFPVAGCLRGREGCAAASENLKDQGKKQKRERKEL